MSTYVAFVRLNVRTDAEIDAKQLGRVLDAALEEGVVLDALLDIVMSRFADDIEHAEVWANVSTITKEDRKR